MGMYLIVIIIVVGAAGYGVYVAQKTKHKIKEVKKTHAVVFTNTSFSSLTAGVDVKKIGQIFSLKKRSFIFAYSLSESDYIHLSVYARWEKRPNIFSNRKVRYTLTDPVDMRVSVKKGEEYALFVGNTKFVQENEQVQIAPVKESMFANLLQGNFSFGGAKAGIIFMPNPEFLSTMRLSMYDATLNPIMMQR